MSEERLIQRKEENNVALREKDLETLRRTLALFPCVREARLFGWRATGHARRASDIDLAISAPDARASEWLELTEALDEAAIIYHLDMVRTEQLRNQDLLDNIAFNGVTIFSRLLQKKS